MLKNKIKKLIKLIENTQIEEIEVSSLWGAQKIRLSKSQNTSRNSIGDNVPNIDTRSIETGLNAPKNVRAENLVESQENSQNLAETTENEVVADNNYEDETKFKIITAPLVGTFYLSPKPGAPSFVRIGDIVNEGMIVCIIEAMKMFNEIDSEFDGEVVEVFVKDGDPVEYGQELFVLKINNV